MVENKASTVPETNQGITISLYLNETNYTQPNPTTFSKLKICQLLVHAINGGIVPYLGAPSPALPLLGLFINTCDPRKLPKSVQCLSL